MKKFLITLLVIVLVLAGGAGYALFANEGAMLTVFSQNQEKIQETITKSSEKLSEQKSFYIEYNVFEKDGANSINMSSKIKLLQLEDESWEFTGVVKTKLKEDSETSEETGNVYYKSGNLYVQSGEEEIENLGAKTLTQALTAVGIYGGLDMIILNSDGFTDNDNELKSTITFSFSPFYVGQKYSFTEDGLNAYIKVSIAGNLKEYGYNATEDEQEMSLSMKYLGTVSSLTFPELPA